MLGYLVGESQLRMPKSVLLIESSSWLPLFSVELECQDEWCALTSPSTRVTGVVISWSKAGLYPSEQELFGVTYMLVMTKSVSSNLTLMVSSSRCRSAVVSAETDSRAGLGCELGFLDHCHFRSYAAMQRHLCITYERLSYTQWPKEMGIGWPVSHPVPPPRGARWLTLTYASVLMEHFAPQPGGVAET